jgi:hypothetical protein
MMKAQSGLHLMRRLNPLILPVFCATDLGNHKRELHIPSPQSLVEIVLELWMGVD